MKEFNPFIEYPDDKLLRVGVALPQEVIEQIDDVLETLPSSVNREHFVACAVLFALREIHHDAAAVLDRN
jgi:hypothetical protein